jgi:hypothetical protein
MAGLAVVPISEARAELGGDCAVEGRLNPGLGCSSTSKGKPCTIAGKAGTCTNMRRPISSLIYCVCLPADGKVPEEVEGKAVSSSGLDKSCGNTVVFTVDKSSPQVLDIALPRNLGGEVVHLETYEGSFTVQTEPIDGNPNACAITLVEGEMTTPSFVLPNGTATGPNTFRFGTPISGQVDLVTGAYTAAARGSITNNLFSGLPTEGIYRGKVDFATGTITIDSTTLDAVPPSTPVSQPVGKQPPS